MATDTKSNSAAAPKPQAKWSDLEKYISAEMLGNRAFDLTISHIGEGDFFSREKNCNVPKPILYFRETPKGLVLTPTNRRRLQNLFGDTQADCLGKKITLIVEHVQAFGLTQAVIRIRTIVPGSDAATKPGA